MEEGQLTSSALLHSLVRSAIHCPVSASAIYSPGTHRVRMHLVVCW